MLIRAIFPLVLFASLCAGQKAYADKYPKDHALTIRHYVFELTLSDRTDEIFGLTSITVRFKEPGVRKMRLDLLNATAQRMGKGMTVESVTLKDGRAIPFTHSGDSLMLSWDAPVDAGTEWIFQIRYHGIPADGLKIGPTLFGSRSFFVENWPNKTRQWLPTIDHPYVKATSEFIVRAPSHYKVVSNGLLMEESTINDSTRLTHWKQSVPVSCWLYVLGVSEFAVQYVGQVDGKSIETWVHPQNREAGFHDFAEPTTEVVKFFSGYVGPYAYEKIANIQSPSIHGGMETSSAIFYGEDLVNGKRDVRLRNVVIHELAHQWFGNAVTESTWDDAWLSEGFATFFTLLFIESAYGHDEFEEGLTKARKTVFDLYAKDTSFSIVADRTAELQPVTTGITYQKGAWFLHMLREKIGHEAFRKGIRSYYAAHFNGSVTTADFLEEMEKVSGQDLHDFFGQWLYHAQNPVLKGAWSFDRSKRKVIIDLEQTQPGPAPFDLPVEFGIYRKGSLKPDVMAFRISTRKATFNIPVDVEPEMIEMDPRTVLLAKMEFTHR
jgi:aminopeptidase N